MFKRLFLLIVSFISILNSNGQQLSYLKVSDGLSSRHTYGIEQDKKGFIWIATNEGIDRFDGSEIKNYVLNSNSILTTELGYRFNIVTDTSKVIWAYTTSGMIFKYDAYIDNFVLNYDLSECANLNEKSPYVFTLYIDHQNQIWIGTTVGIFYVVPGKMDHPIHILGQQRTFAFEEFHPGEICAGTNNGVITIGNKEQVNEHRIVNTPLGIASSGIKVRSLFYEQKNKQLWIGSEDKGPSIYNFPNSQLIDLQNSTPNVPIRSIQPDLNNNILIGLDGAGIVSIDPIDYKVIDKWEKLNENQFGLSDNSVMDIYCDNFGKIWVSTWSDGITILDLEKPGIEIFRHQLNSNNSLKDDNVNAICQDSDNNIWFGTNNGVSILQANGQWSHLAGMKGSEEISGYKILAICEDNQRRIWIGGYANGLHCYNKNTGLLTNFTKDIGSNHIYSIYFDQKDHIWFGGVEGNLSVLNLRSQQFEKLPVTNITCMAYKGDHEIWAGGTTGLFFANNANNKAGNAIADISDRLSNHYINCILPDEQQNLWIGTNGGGLNLYQRELDSMEVLSVEHGLPSNFVCGILKDALNRMWLSTDKGICCIDTDQNRSVNTGTIHGLTDGSFNNNACEKLKNGDFIFGSASGAIRFTPEKIVERISKSQLVFNDFKVSYRTVKPALKKSPLKIPIDETKTILLKHNQNSFSFQFSTINFDNSDQLAYHWKLENFEADWTPLINSKMAGYTNIPPGEYIFRLECVNLNDLTASDSRSIKIIIEPPLWATNGAYLFYVLFAFSLALLIYRLQQDRLQKQHSDDKIRFFINTAHDIKTPLSLIKAPLKDLEGDKGLTNQGIYFLKLAQTNVDRLAAIVNQVLDFDKYDSGKFKLTLSYNNLNTYLNDKMESYLALAKMKEIILTLELPKQEILVEFDLAKMDKIMDNLISNAIKYTLEKGSINIIASENENEWSIEVIDNGIGIPKKNQKELFKLYYRAENAINSRNPGSGIGLMLTQHLVKMHHGKISFYSQENKGSEFKIRFPKGRINKGIAIPHAMAVDKLKSENYIYPAQKEQVTLEPSSLPGSLKKILVVEDDDDLRNYFENSLKSKYLIYTAADGEIALQMIENESFDLVLSDVMMPNLRGDEMCRRIKENINTSHLPVILLTALSDSKNTISGLEAGADNYVNKPFDIEVIHARIENIFKNRALLRENLLRGSSDPAEKVEISNLDQVFVQKLMEILNKEIANPDFSVDVLCQEVGMSRTPLYKKIKDLTNLSPTEFIRINRMNRAIDLLKSGKYSISEVGIQVGFDDSKYFSTAFKKFFGKSPKHYLQ
ncbi:MAG: two-component regulator propeller domain-containing protein [Prolixibacteraceae bacterium]